MITRDGEEQGRFGSRKKKRSETLFVPIGAHTHAPIPAIGPHNEPGLTKRSSRLLRTCAGTLKSVPGISRDADMIPACFQPCISAAQIG